MDDDTDGRDEYCGPDEPEDDPPPNTIALRLRKSETRAAARARGALSPELGATLALQAFSDTSQPYGEVPVGVLHEELKHAVRDESATGTDRLMAQAIVLDRLFSHMTAVAMDKKSLPAMAPALTLAFRAQAQCRATLQAVSDIKHPRQYIGQQTIREQYNSSGGHQQVNRDAHGSTGENRPNELSEGTANELHQNSGTPAGVEGAGDAVETVGARDRAANG